MNNPIDVDSQLNEIHELIDSERFAELLVRAERYLVNCSIPGIEAELRRAKALAHTGLGEWNGAIEEWSKVIEILPERASSYRGRGAARERVGDSSGAIADYIHAVELSPRNAAIHDILPHAAIRDEAIWLHALETYDRDKRDPQLQVRGFCCCGGGHQGPQAESEYYLKRGYCDCAEDTFTRILEENPDNVRAWFDRASVRHCKRNWDEVIADCSRAIALDPEFADAYLLRGSAHDKKGELVPAVADWTRAIALHPRDIMAYTLRALAYEALGRDIEARSDRVRAFELCKTPEPT